MVKSKHGLRTYSSRRFQWYPTTYMCWAMTKPLLWIKLILSHSKGWVGLNTYRLRGIIGIVLMSTFLIHAYFLRSRPFAKPCLFSREISTVASSEASSNNKIEASRLWRPSSFDWFVTSDWHIGQGETGDSCFRLACLPFGRVMILASVFWSVAPSGGKIENSAKVLPPLCQSCFLLYISHFDLEARLIGRNNNKQYRSSLYIEGIWEERNKKLVLCDILSNQGHTLNKVISPSIIFICPSSVFCT